MKKIVLSTLVTMASYIGYSQNVGIGESNPASKGSVKGNLSVGNNYSTTAAPANGAIIEGNVGIGTNAPNTKAQLDISSTNSGVLIPRMTLTQRGDITSPPTGLLIYQTDNTPGFYYYNGSAWVRISESTNGIQSVGVVAPLQSTGGGNPTLSIPQSNVTTNGFLSSADWNTFNNKLGTSLSNGRVWIGDATNTAQPTAITGDATLSNTGVLTLANTGVAAGAYGSATTVPIVTVDAKGRITGVTTTTISGVAPGGAAGGDLTGTYPNPTIANNAVSSAEIIDGTVANADLANMAANTIKGNNTASPAVPTDITVGANTVLGRQGANIVAAQVATDQIADNATTNAKLSDMATQTIKGRTTAGTGDPEDLTPTQVRTMLNVADGANAHWTRTSTTLAPTVANDIVNVPVDRTASFGITGNNAATAAATGDRGGVAGLFSLSGTSANGYLGFNSNTGFPDDATQTKPATAGIYGIYNGTTSDRYAIFGEVENSNATSSTNKIAIYGRSNNTNGNRFGVVGDAMNSGSGNSRAGVLGLSGQSAVSISGNIGTTSAAVMGISEGGDFSLYGYSPTSTAANPLFAVASNIGGTRTNKFRVNADGQITTSLTTAGFVKTTAGGVLSSAAQVALSSEVTGTLPIANGGTNSSTALNNNRLMVSSGGAIVESAALTANSPLYTNASGLPTTTAPSSGAIGYWTRSGTNLYNTTLTDNVGIGASSPGVKLDLMANTTGTIFRITEGTTTPGSGVFTEFSRNNITQRGSNLGLRSAEGDIIFSTTASFTDRMVIKNTTGNVGIGTSSPGTSLEVIGNTAVHGNMNMSWGERTVYVQHPDPYTASPGYLMGYSVNTNLRRLFIDNRNSDPSSADPNGGITFRTGGTLTDRLHVSYSGNVGIGTTSPATALDVIGTIRAGGATGKISITNDNSNGSLTNTAGSFLFYTPTSTNYIWHVNNAEQMRLSSDGRLGIGTNAPNDRLHVNGGGVSITSTGNAFINFDAGTGSAAGNQVNYIDFRINGTVRGNIAVSEGTSGNPLELNSATNAHISMATGGGNVGVGTASPAHKLDVNGPARFQDVVIFKQNVWNRTDDGQNRFYFGANSRTYYGSGNGHEWRNAADQNIMELQNSGLLYLPSSVTQSGLNYAYYAYNSGPNTTISGGCINCSGPYSLWASERIRAAEFCATSDARIKTDVTPLSSASQLSELNRLPVVSYTYIDKLSKGFETKTGFLAQQVEAVNDNFVHKTHDYIPSVFALAKAAESKGTQLTVTTEKAHGFAVGEEVKFYAEGKKEVNKTVLSVQSETTFTVADWTEPTKDLFVYGKKVDDFRVVDFDQITALSVGAIQELSKQVKQLEEENGKLKTVLSSKADASDFDKLKAEIQYLKDALLKAAK